MLIIILPLFHSILSIKIMDKVYAYVDGAVKNNQAKENLGSWGVILIYKYNTKELYGIIENTTNNICEITATISALENIKRKDLPTEVISDSQYVVSGVNEWSKKWAENGWKNSQGKVVENLELWKKLLSLITEFKDIQFIKTHGHSTDKTNNEVDFLCNRAIKEYLNEKG